MITWVGRRLADIDRQTRIEAAQSFAGTNDLFPQVDDLAVENTSDDDLEGLTLTVRSDPAILGERTWTIDRIAAKSQLRPKDVRVPLAGGLLDKLTDRLRSDVTFTLRQGELVLAEEHMIVEALARNEWGGSRFMPELLAAFVTPNDGTIQHLLKERSSILSSSGRDGSIDGYQKKSRERVWEVMSGVWAAVSARAITYAVQPASFETTGQKIRLPSELTEAGGYLRDVSFRREDRVTELRRWLTDDRLAARLLTVCRGDTGLRDRALPYAPLLRTDPWGYPLVHHKGAFVVVLGADRRESGTHYTPKSLTEKIVEETLTPIVYRGPAEGKAPAEWELKSAEELLDLKICDPAMGSGAFLVQACRWLSARLVEAWSVTEKSGKRIDIEGRILDEGDGAGFEPLSQNVEERAILARRLIAERCLYGVDRNPLAVELAKLSLWLTTMSKGRPFGFLDHNLRSGDSLLGIHDLGQLVELDMNPKGKAQLRLFGRISEKVEGRGRVYAIR